MIFTTDYYLISLYYMNAFIFCLKSNFYDFDQIDQVKRHLFIFLCFYFSIAFRNAGLSRNTYPANIYLFKVNNGNTRNRCEILFQKNPAVLCLPLFRRCGHFGDLLRSKS